MSRRRRIGRVLWLSVAALVVGAALITIAPSITAPLVSRRLSLAVGAHVRVGWISWNPLVGRVVLHRVSISTAIAEPSAITVGALEIDVAVRRWVRGEVALDALVLRQPWVGLRRTATGDFNLGALLGPSPPAEQATRASTDGDRGLRIGTFRIVGGSIEFRDQTTEPPLETSLYFEEAAAHDLVLARSGRTAVSVHLESRLEHKPLTLDLSYRASGADSDLKAKLETSGVSLSRALLYLPLGWQRVSGTLDATVSYEREMKNGALEVHGLQGHAVVRDLALVEPWALEPAVRASRLRLGRLAVDVKRRRTDLGTIDVDDFFTLITRDAGGVRVPLVDLGPTGSGSGWRTALSEVRLGVGRVSLRDVVPGAKPEITAQVRSGKITPRDDGVALALDTTVASGRLTLEGEAGSARTRLGLTLDDLSLPEVAELLRLPVAFASGHARGQVTLRVGTEPTRLSGELALPDAKSVASAHPEEVFAWQDLQLTLAESTLDPLRLHVTTLTAVWPYLMIHRSDDGLYPFVAAAAAPRGQPAEHETPRSEPGERLHELVVDHGVVRGGRVEFYDSTLPTPYGVDLVDPTASFESLTFAPLTIGELHVTGSLDELSPVELHGMVGMPETNLRLTVDRLLLPPLSPYLAPALDHEIIAGTAQLKSEIRLAGSRVEAANDLVLSRLSITAGGEDRFASTLGVPLTVALALMKDTRGDIRLQVPVEGDLAAQEYRVGSVLGEALQSALAGAVRTPLRLLGQVFGREETEDFDLAPVPFAAGSAALGPRGEERIAQVAKLVERHANVTVLLSSTPTTADATLVHEEPGAELADRLAALGAARVAAVARRLTEAHGIDTSRVEATPSEAEEPGAGEPGVDVRLQIQ